MIEFKFHGCIKLLHNQTALKTNTFKYEYSHHNLKILIFISLFTMRFAELLTHFPQIN